MKVTACTACPLIAEGESESRSGKRLAGTQVIFRVVLVDSGKEVVPVALVGVDGEAVVSAVAQGSANHASDILLSLAVEREHHLGMGSVGVAHTVLVLYHLHARFKRFFAQTSLVCPLAVERREPHRAAANGEVARCKLAQCHRLLLIAVYDFGPCFNHIHGAVSLIAHSHGERIHLVAQRDAGDGEVGSRFGGNVGNLQVERHVAVGKSRGKGSLARAVETVGWISVVACIFGGTDYLSVGGSEFVAEIDELQILALLGLKQHRHSRSGNLHILSHHSGSSRDAGDER